MRSIYADPAHWATINLMELPQIEGWLVTGVTVAPRFRGQGYASDLLERVCQEADEEGVRLYLEIQPDGTGLSEAALDAFYGKHGFTEWVDGDELSRIREPQAD